MALSAGDPDTYTGLAGRLRSKFEAYYGEAFQYDSNVGANFRLIAEAIIEELQENGDVRIGSNDAGLQRDPTSGIASLAPLNDVVLSGAIE